MVRKSTSNDSISSYNYMDKQVMSGSNEAVGLRNGDNGKFKDKICHGGASGGGSTDSEVLSSWPSRHYTCNFCKRRFKSAQALGGHMNVHRRARAMLISPISSPPSSPWLPNSITSANNPFQHDDHHLTYPNPTPNYPHWPLYTPHCTINPSPSNLSHLPMFNLTQSCSLVSSTHKNSILPAACICRHMLNADQYHHAELRTTDQRVMKNCIRAENQVNGSGSRTRVHQDDMVSGLSLGTTVIPSRPAAEEDVDLELRLGF